MLATTFAATDIIQTAKSKTIGPLKKILSNQLVSSGASKALWKVLNLFGLAPSQEFQRLDDAKESVQRLREGIPDLDPHDLLLILYDNIGFRKLGSKPGYEQYTALQIIRVATEKLIEWGVYPKEDDVIENCASRERINWENARDHVSFEDVMSPTSDDANRLSGLVLDQLKLLLTMESEKRLPTTDECRDALEDEDASQYLKHPVQITEVAGGRRVVDQAMGAFTTQSHVGADDIGKFDTNMEANNAVGDRTMKKDLNATSTQVALMEYAIELLKKATGLEVQPGSFWERIPTIMSSYGVPLCGDGLPTYGIKSVLKKETETYLKKVIAFFGGFHVGLTAHKKRGAIFANSHLNDVFSSWRTTNGQLKWVTEPGDPNQIESELPMYVLGMYTGAMRAMLIVKIAEAEAQDDDVEEIKVSPGDVVDFMINRSKEEPLVFVMLIRLLPSYAPSRLMKYHRDSQASSPLTPPLKRSQFMLILMDIIPHSLMQQCVRIRHFSSQIVRLDSTSILHLRERIGPIHEIKNIHIILPLWISIVIG